MMMFGLIAATFRNARVLSGHLIDAAAIGPDQPLTIG